MFTSAQIDRRLNEITEEEWLVGCDWINSNGKEYISEELVFLIHTSFEHDNLLAKYLPHYTSEGTVLIRFQKDLLKDLLDFIGINHSILGNISTGENFNKFVDPRLLA